MLITVGVLLDTMRQVETFLLQRHYDGFLKKGRMRGRGANRQTALSGGVEFKSVAMLYGTLGAIFIVGILAWGLQKF